MAREQCDGLRSCWTGDRCVWIDRVAQAPVAAPPPHVSPEVLADRRVTFRIYAPKATEVTVRGDWMTPAPGSWRRTRGRLVGHGRPAGPGLLQLRVHGGRGPHPGPEERDDQAGHRQPRQHVLPARPGGRLPGQQAGPARRRAARCGTSPARSRGSGGCTSTRRRGTTRAATSTRSSTCCTAAATRTRAGARSAGPGSSWTT